MDEGSDSYLSLVEIANRIQISPRGLARWCASGYLPAVKFGKQWRVRAQDFDVWLREHHHVAAQPQPGAIGWRIYTSEKEAHSSTHAYEREMRYAALQLASEIEEKRSSSPIRRKKSS